MKRFIVLASIVLALPSSAIAQVDWRESSEGMSGGIANVFTTGPNAQLYLGASNGVYRYDRDAQEWEHVVDEPNVTSLIVCGDGTIIVGCDGGLRRYPTAGSAAFEQLFDGVISSIVQSVTGTIVVGFKDRRRAMRSTDCGATWAELEINLPSIAVSRAGVFYAFDQSVARSTDDGRSWSDLATPSSVHLFAPVGASELIATSGSLEKLFRSTDLGATWTTHDSPSMTSLIVGSHAVWAIRAPADSSESGFYQLSADRTRWDRIDDDHYTTAYERVNGELWIGTIASVHRSTDGGETSTDASRGFTALLVHRILRGSGAVLYALTGTEVPELGPITYSLYRSADNGKHWLRVMDGLGDASLIGATVRVKGDAAFIVQPFEESPGARAVYSFDNGVRWDSMAIAHDSTFGLVALGPDRAAFVVSKIGDDPSVLRVTTDRGATWRDTSLWASVQMFFTSSGMLVASIRHQIPDGSFIPMLKTSTDGGRTWRNVGDSLMPLSLVESLDGDIYVETRRTPPVNDYITRLLRSTDGGMTFNAVPLQYHRPLTGDLFLTPLGALLYSGEDVFRSTDGGQRWDTVDLPKGRGPRLIVNDNVALYSISLRTSGTDGALRRSTDEGRTWTLINSPWRGRNPTSFTIAENGDLIAGTDGAGIFRAVNPLVSVENDDHRDQRDDDRVDGRVDADAMRMRISPNPTLEGATIAISIVQRGHVRVSVRDINGRVVSSIFDGDCDSGTLVLNAPSMLSSGAYVVTARGEHGAVARLLFVR